MSFEKFSSCPSCNNKDEEVVVDLGAMPPVNAFIESEKVEAQEKFPLQINFCKNCSLVHIDSYVSPEVLFSQYLHMSSASEGNKRHLKGVASLVRERLNLKKGMRVLEIGSNDGSLLKELKPFCSDVLGVDPAKNLSELANAEGVKTINSFFNENVAKEIKEEHGTFDAIIALNVVAHTPTFISMLRGISHLLAPNAQFMMENAYVVETILEGQFDTVYHEHVSNFSLHSLAHAYRNVGLKPLAAEIIPTQGRSIRVWCGREEDSLVPDSTVSNLLQREKDKGLVDSEKYKAVADKVQDFRENLKSLIEEKKKQNKKIIGLGAPARGVVVINYCDLDNNDLHYIIDDTTLKHGKCIPGKNIEVTSWERLETDSSDSFLLLSWNYEEDMIRRLRERAPKGSKVIIPFPELREIQI